MGQRTQTWLLLGSRSRGTERMAQDILVGPLTQRLSGVEVTLLTLQNQFLPTVGYQRRGRRRDVDIVLIWDVSTAGKHALRAKAASP